MKKIIFWLFAILFFLVPLVLWPYTSEVFEFNKMVLVYILSLLIVGAWIIRSILERKFVFRRTILDKPLLIFFASQVISTILSVEPLTSVFGYYSRFNGGLISVAVYSLLYWAFVSNLDEKDSFNLINYSFLPSAALVAAYGVAEHFGIDKSIWVQDVQSRVFSTLGQPNWLAAWLVALMPISWALVIKAKFKSINFWLNLGYSVLFFWTLIFTKSRSGLLGFAAAFAIFWGFYFWQNKKNYKKILLPFGVVLATVAAIILISGTEVTPGLLSLIFKNNSQTQTASASGNTALDTGGTESGTIRKFVWEGALNIWAHYPIFGTGVETFAYSYYKYRPLGHNLTSEWDFIYNKAHNEFLNMAANSGTVGLGAYLAVIGFTIYIFIKKRDSIFAVALLAGYISLSVCDFFGFSVVPTQLQFFLYPAFAVVLGTIHETGGKKVSISGNQKTAIFILSAIIIYPLILIFNYWLADTYYNKGMAYNSLGRPDMAVGFLTQAINLEPYQPLYYAGSHARSESYATLAVAYREKDATGSAQLVNLALADSQKAADLAPGNLLVKRVRFGLFITLSSINPNYLINARDVLLDTLVSAPTDPKLYYNLGLVYARISQPDLAETTFKKTIELKGNYKEPRLALAYILIDKKDYAGARTQLEYILSQIDPNDSLSKQALAGLPAK